jgi:hypothetical protein
MRKTAMLLVLFGCGGGDGGETDVGDVPGDTDETDVPANDDADGDGFTSGDDCDDHDDSAYPGASETCDGHDDDCDDSVDEDAVDASTWFVDGDGDGHGTTGATTTACDPPDGYAAADDDCDDGDGAVHPGADEVCGNGKDDDCAGDDGTCGVDRTADLEDARLILDGTGTDSYFGYQVRSDDFDGDGTADVAISHAYPGTPITITSGALTGYVDATDAFATATAGTSGRWWNSLTSADLDGDGYADLAGGIDREDSKWANDGGVVWGWAGPLAGDLTGSDALFTIHGSTGSDNQSVAEAFSDLNGDGSADLAIGAFENAEGAVLVFWGPLTGELDSDDAPLEIHGVSGDGFGKRVCSAGDQNGDGLEELVVTAWDYNGGRGRLLVYETPLTAGAWTMGEADWVFDAASGGMQLATCARPGDIDGDGTTDLLFGSYATGQAFLFYGPITGHPDVPRDEDARFTGTADKQFSYGVASGGDADGDGNDDVLLAANYRGNAYLWLGGGLYGSHDQSTADVTFSAAAASSEVGNHMDFVPDVDGDGRDELLIPDTVHGGTSKGRVYLLGLGGE